MLTETMLYLALRNILAQIDKQEREEPQTVPVIPHSVEMPGRLALQQFEMELGPLPEWASAFNFERKPVLYSQLYTLDSAARGNAMIYHVGNSGQSFGVITDMGNTFSCSLGELEQMFDVGRFIMNEDGYAKRWRQNPESQREEPSSE